SRVRIPPSPPNQKPPAPGRGFLVCGHGVGESPPVRQNASAFWTRSAATQPRRGDFGPQGRNHQSLPHRQIKNPAPCRVFLFVVTAWVRPLPVIHDLAAFVHPCTATLRFDKT